MVWFGVALNFVEQRDEWTGVYIKNQVIIGFLISCVVGVVVVVVVLGFHI